MHHSVNGRRPSADEHCLDPSDFTCSTPIRSSSGVLPYAVITEELELFEYERAKEAFYSAEETAEVVAEIDIALSELPPAKRRVLQLLFWDELPAKDVAEICGVSRPRVSQIMHECFEILRPLLKDVWYH